MSKRLVYRCMDCKLEFMGPNVDGMRCYLCDNGLAIPIREATDEDRTRFILPVMDARGRKLAMKGGESD